MGKKGYLTPDEAAGSCIVTIELPAGRDWRAIFFGAVLELARPWNWEKFGEMTPEESADRMWTAYETMEWCEDEMIQDVRIEDCELQKQIDGAWVPAGSIACGVQSVVGRKGGYLVSTDGSGNETYVSSEYTAADIAALPQIQQEDNTEANVCAGVRFLNDRYWADVMYALDQVQLVVDQVKLAAETASAIINTIPFFGQVPGIIFDGWEEWLGQSITLGISTLKLAFTDPAVRSKFQENLFCAIIDNENYLLTQEIFFNAAEDLPLLETQSTHLADFMQGFHIPELGTIFQTALSWYNMGAMGSDPTCGAEYGCSPGWCLEADLTLTDGGLTVQAGASNNGVWVSGTGWTAATSFAGGAYHKNMNLEGFFPEATYTGAGMTFTQEWGNIPGGSELWWVLGAGDHAYSIITNNVAPESPWDVSGAEHTGDRALFVIPVGVLESGDPGGFATMTRARLYGVGEPPEIAGWELCE